MQLARFFPILTAFTARVAGCEPGQLFRSPTALARALADTQVVVGHDGVLCIFEPALLASVSIREPMAAQSSAGAGGDIIKAPEDVLGAAPLSTLLESIEPLRHLLPDSAKIYATFSGPALLFSQLQGSIDAHGGAGGVDPDDVIDIVLAVVRAALELPADGIALIEQTTLSTPEELVRTHRKVRKLADFYDAGLVEFSLPGSAHRDAGRPAHCVFELGAAADGLGVVTGKPGAGGVFESPPRTTGGDLPASTPVEDLKALLYTAR